MDELFYSPLGVLVLARSIIEVSGVPSAMLWAENLGFYPAEDIASCLQALSLRVPGKGYFDQLSPERLSELIVQGEQDLTPYHDGYQQQTDVLLASGFSLKPFAAHLLEADGTATWFTDLDRKRQEWVSSTGLPPHVSSFHPDLRCYGAGITKPRQTLWTSTRLAEHSSSWLHYLRWGEDHREPPYHRWRLEVLPSARVYEIHGPQAWQSLCLAYPAPSCMAYSICGTATRCELKKSAGAYLCGEEASVLLLYCVSPHERLPELDSSIFVKTAVAHIYTYQPSMERRRAFQSSSSSVLFVPPTLQLRTPSTSFAGSAGERAPLSPRL